MGEFCHELERFEVICRAVGGEKSFHLSLQKKIIGLCTVFGGLKNLGFKFHLKGGTSLSKGWNVLNRFSEDIDIYIFPPDNIELKTGRNQNKPQHINGRSKYFEELVTKIKIPGIAEAVRDKSFDDEFMRNAGIRLMYESKFDNLEGVKPGILLEVGFDQTTPNELRDISSWVYDSAIAAGVEVNENIAKEIPCYCPEYTFVEKLQTISTKFRQEQESGELKENQLRHYYDIMCLLQEDRVKSFIGSKEYFEHKKKRFRQKDEPDLTKNEAFILSDTKTFEKYENGLTSISNLFYGDKPNMKGILQTLSSWLRKL